MLRRLAVKNLGPISHAVLDDRAPVTLLLGPNESGKTTLLEAPSVLYFGTRGDVPVGENRALTRDGAKGWTVELAVGEHELHATRSNRPSQKECQEALGDPRVFRSLTHLQTFLDLDPASRKMMLADLNAADTGPLLAKLRELVAPPAVIQEVERGNMKRAQAQATEARRTVGRMLKNAKTFAEQEPEDEEVETKRGKLRLSELPLATIEASLQRLRTRRDKVVQAVAQRRAMQAVIDAGEKAREELETLKADASWSDSDEGALLQIARDLDECRKIAQEATAEIALASRGHRELERLVKEGAGECPTCTRPFEEDEANEALRSLRSQASSAINRGRKVQEAQAERAKALGKEQKTLSQRKAHAQAQSTYRRRLQDAVDAAERADVPDEPAESSLDLDAELKRVGAIRDRRRDYELKLRQREEAKGKVPRLQKQVDALATIEALVDPSAMDDEEAVLAQLNGLLKRTTGKLGALVTVSPGYEVTIQGRDAGLASDSARIRAGFGIACALSVISGVGIALLDRFESLDDSNRKRALGMVKGLVDDGLLSSVLIAAVKEEPKRGADVPWLAWAKVMDGTVEYL